jgi:hypothetical protein
MRRPRREVAGGEMALMAVMTKAMGAFLVIMIMLLPYYTGDTAAQQTIDQTNEQIRKAGDDLAQVKQILGKGRLSDKEIDELIKKIEDAQKALDEARALVATLQVKLDQAQSQITRLEAESKALTAQVEDLTRRLAEAQAEAAKALALAEQMKNQLDEANANVARLADENKNLADEIDRLKKSKRALPEILFVLRWRGCPGADLQLYVQSNVKAPDGRLAPAPDLTIQDPFWSDDIVPRSQVHLTDAVGTTWWRSKLSGEEEKFAVWAKYLNPLPFDPQQCDVQLDVSYEHELSSYSLGGLSSRQPVSFLSAFQIDKHSSIVAEADFPNLRATMEAVGSSTCQALLCLVTVADPDAARLEEATKTYLIERSAIPVVRVEKQVVPIASEIAHLIATRAATPMNAYAFIDLLHAPLKGADVDLSLKADPAQLAEIEALMAQKGVPPLIRAEIKRLLGTLRFEPLKNKLLALPNPTPRLSVGAEKFVAMGAPEDVANAFAADPTPPPDPIAKLWIDFFNNRLPKPHRAELTPDEKHILLTTGAPGFLLGSFDRRLKRGELTFEEISRAAEQIQRGGLPQPRVRQ